MGTLAATVNNGSDLEPGAVGLKAILSPMSVRGVSE